MKAGKAIVVGSGPASLACIEELLIQGWIVVCLDVGLTLEKEKEEYIQKLAKKDRDDFSPQDIDFVKGTSGVSTKGVEVKKIFDSDFPYRKPHNLNYTIESHLEGLLSFAKGGFSNVWGSAVLPYLPEDFSDWGVGYEEMLPFYQKILERNRFMATKDDLVSRFPLLSDNYETSLPSQQACLIDTHLKKNKQYLGKKSVVFGFARLLIKECKYCGLCLHGCPYKKIYSSAYSIDKCMGNKNFHYLKGYLVDTFIEKEGGVVVRGIVLDTKEIFEMKGDKLFLGAGSLSSTKIVMKSLDIYNQKIKVLDSQYFGIPCFTTRSVKHEVKKEKLYTLSQLFIDIDNKKLTDHNVHIQLYTYNQMFSDLLKKKLGFLYKVGLFSFLEKRLIFLQGFMHSNESSCMHVELKQSGAEDKFIITDSVDKEAIKKVKKLSRFFLFNFITFGFFPLLPLLGINKPGRGYHFGGTMPMMKKDNDLVLSTDHLGRPNGLQHVHVIDASVFPSIPSATIALSIMANACRIAYIVSDNSGAEETYHESM